MEPNLDSRAHALQLLKSKLRANGRSRRKSKARVAEDLTPNQQESVQPSEQRMVLRKPWPMLSEPQVDEEAKLPASVAPTCCNQDDISVAELRQEFSELKMKSSAPIVGLVAPPAFPMKLKSYTKKVIQWSCDVCERECIPVREESRCLCGHRYKEHPSSADNLRVKPSAGFREFACTSTKCSCKAFFYVVAEGAWILRCRCKHRHTDHNPASKPFVCKKAKCGCQGFDSPWVCNCSHPWASHRQHRVEKRFDALQLLQDQFSAPELNAVHRTDLVASPLNLRL